MTDSAMSAAQNALVNIGAGLIILFFSSLLKHGSRLGARRSAAVLTWTLFVVGVGAIAAAVFWNPLLDMQPTAATLITSVLAHPIVRWGVAAVIVFFAVVNVAWLVVERDELASAQGRPYSKFSVFVQQFFGAFVFRWYRPNRPQKGNGPPPELGRIRLFHLGTGSVRDMLGVDAREALRSRDWILGESFWDIMHRSSLSAQSEIVQARNERDAAKADRDTEKARGDAFAAALDAVAKRVSVLDGNERAMVWRLRFDSEYPDCDGVDPETKRVAARRIDEFEPLANRVARATVELTEALLRDLSGVNDCATPLAGFVRDQVLVPFVDSCELLRKREGDRMAALVTFYARYQRIRVWIFRALNLVYEDAPREVMENFSGFSAWSSVDCDVIEEFERLMSNGALECAAKHMKLMRQQHGYAHVGGWPVH